MARAPVKYGLGAVLFVSALVGFGNDVGSAVSKAGVIDRTFGCIPVALNAPLRSVDISTVPLRGIEGNDPFQHGSPGFIGVASGGSGPHSDLLSVRARGWQRSGSTFSTAGVYASIERCARSRIAIPLSAQGLSGPPVRWTKEATCLGRGRVIVRVRATLELDVSWQALVVAAYDGARSNVVKAAVAIRSEQTGKPLAYIELDRNGKTKLWYAPHCVS